MHSPVFASIKRHNPNCHLTVWVAPRGTRLLAENNPHIDNVIESPIQLSLWQHLKHTASLRKQSFDAGVMLSPGQQWKGAFYLFMAGIKNRIAHSYPHKQITNSHFLLTQAIDEQLDIHDIEQNLNLLPLLGLKKPDQSPDYSFQIPKTFISSADATLSTLNIPSDQPLIGLHPGSAPNFTWKRWPQENFLKIAQHFIKDLNAHILIFGGSNEKSIKTFIHQNLPSGFSSIINENLLTTAAIMQHCRFLVTNDSGLMHLASAAHVPTFGLFGPTNEKLTGPRGKQSFVIRAPNTHPVYNTESHFDLGTTTHSTLLALTPEYVIQTISRVPYRN
jgi:heptosyltransferase II